MYIKTEFLCPVYKKVKTVTIFVRKKRYLGKLPSPMQMLNWFYTYASKMKMPMKTVCGLIVYKFI